MQYSHVYGLQEIEKVENKHGKTVLPKTHFYLLDGMILRLSGDPNVTKMLPVKRAMKLAMSNKIHKFCFHFVTRYVFIKGQNSKKMPCVLEFLRYSNTCFSVTSRPISSKSRPLFFVFSFVQWHFLAFSKWLLVSRN